MTDTNHGSTNYSRDGTIKSEPRKDVLTTKKTIGAPTRELKDMEDV